MSALALIAVLIAAAWFWLDSARAREIAIGICRETSERYGVQLLDDSVALSKLSIRWPDQGLRIWRQFSFDFSRDGAERLQGQLALTGINLDYLDFDFSVIDVNAEPPETINAGNVLPIRKNSKKPDNPT